MAQLEAVGISGSQQQPLPTSSEVHGPTQSLTIQENQATIHDFLSLCGSTIGRSASATAAPNHGSQPLLSTTQDLLEPLQQCLIPVGSTNTNLRPNGFKLGPYKPHIGSSEPGTGQQSCYAFSNGSFEPKEGFTAQYRPANITFGTKGHVTHTSPLGKHWPHQASGEVFDGNKRFSRVPSEEDDDEDDGSCEQIYSNKKDGRCQKGENSQLIDGRYQDKGITPRSKHSATEQRRRSKINDRFQMLRQLLPNTDQKRDKASFLLEVIEYIQMLHEKVQKFEGLEFRGPNQEQTKLLPWDRIPAQQDVTFGPAQELKELTDANGYLRSHVSPLTGTSEDGMTSSGLMCSMVQPAALRGVLNFESKPGESKSIPLDFSQARPATMTEQASNHTHPNILLENQTFLSHVLRPEDQTTTKARDLFSTKTETPEHHVHQQSHNVEDQRLSSLRSTLRSMDQQNASALVCKRSEQEAEGQDRSSHARETGSISGNVVRNPLIGLDRNGVLGCSEGSRLEQKTDAIAAAKEEAVPAALGGVINISSSYSQGLLDTLTRALQSSGVDMAQATISVQIDLGKPDSSSSKQMIPLPSGSPPLRNNQTMSTNELKPPYKKFKVEAD